MKCKLHSDLAPQAFVDSGRFIEGWRPVVGQHWAVIGTIPGACIASHVASEEVVQVLLAFMYGRLTELQDNLLLPLFMVADAYQASLLPDFTYACYAD